MMMRIMMMRIMRARIMTIMVMKTMTMKIMTITKAKMITTTKAKKAPLGSTPTFTASPSSLSPGPAAMLSSI